MKRERPKRKTSFDTVISHREASLKKGQNSMIGVDIGSSFVKMVQMKKNYKIVRSGIEPIPGGMMNQGRIEAPSELAEIIRRTSSKNKIKGNQCSLCISGNELIVRELKLPEMSEDQIMDNIRHEITSFLPLNHEDYSIDYKVLEYIPSQDGTPGKLKLMVAAVPKDIVEGYISTLRKAGLKVSYVDVAPNIAGKMTKWMKMNHISEAGNIGIIDFGAHYTNIILLKDGSYCIHKTITNGGEYLTSNISDKLKIDFAEAESFKKKANFFENNFQNNACESVRNYFDYMINDVERTIEYYRSRNNQAGLDHIYTMGGGSLLKGLSGYLQEHLMVEVSPLSEAFQYNRKDNRRGNDNADKAAAISMAIGATMREE